MKGKVMILIAAVVLVFLIQPAACSWQIQTVDTGNVGGSTSLVIGTDGVQHISYYDFANKTLKYAFYDGSWHTTTVDTMPYAGIVGTSIQLWNNHPCIAYSSNVGTKYAENMGSGWINYVLDPQGSGAPSMVMMPNNDIAVSYYSASKGGVRSIFYYSDVGYWSKIWDIGASPPTYVSTYNHVVYGTDAAPGRGVGFFYEEHVPNSAVWGVRASWINGYGYYLSPVGGPETIDATNASSFGPLSMVERNSSYTSGENTMGYQKLFTYTDPQRHLMFGDSFRTDFFPRSHVVVADGQQQYASDNSLVLDKVGLPAIVYIDPTDFVGFKNRLRYAWNDGFWHAVTVDTTSSQSPSLAFDPNGNPVISYFDANSLSLKVARSSDIYPQIPVSKSYEQYLTLIGSQMFNNNQEDRGGCQIFTIKHMVDIKEEMLAPYTPDISYSFIPYVLNKSWGKGGGTPDSRVPHDQYMEGFKVMKIYGSPPETSYPSNYDILGTTEPNIYSHFPSNEAFSNATYYRIDDASWYSGTVLWPQSALTERLLAINGPVWCQGLLSGHVLAIIGYDHTKQEFTFVDSANWWGESGVHTMNYSKYDRGMSMNSGAAIVAIKDQYSATSVIQPYTARINITQPNGRKFLEVKIGVVGQTPLTVWNQNNRYNWSENFKSLVIDVALPSYAQSHWPPSASNPWYVSVINHDPNVNGNAFVNEITLVKRTHNGNSYIIEKHQPNTLPSIVPPNGITTISIPSPIMTVTSPNGGETWQRGTSRTVTWDYMGSTGSTVKIVLLKGGVEVGTIASSVPIGIGTIGGGGSGSYSWAINSSGMTGSDFKVKISSISQPTITDASNGYFTLSPALSTPSITVISPNGGESWQRGTTNVVRWSYTGSPGSTVKISLLRAGAEVGIINASTPTGSRGYGSYSWPISPTGSTGKDYKVSVQSISQPTIKNSSDNYFSLTPAPTTPTITVTTPNGGETWQRGTTHMVNWSYTGNPGSTVKIMLLKGGVEVGTIIAGTSTGSSGKGSFTWPISVTGGTGSDYRVKVQSISLPTINDTSNNNFNLTPAGPIPPSITVTAPNGGETWKRGTTHRVNWSYTGSPGSTVKIVLWKAGVPVGTINSSTSIGSGGQGSYTWPISTTGLTGTDFKVNVSSISQPTIFDMSSNIFTITL